MIDEQFCRILFDPSIANQVCTGAWDIVANLAAGLIGGLITLLVRWGINRYFLVRRRRLAGYVFPVFTDARGKDPVIHLRASFDELVAGSGPPTLRGYTHSGDVQAIMSIADFFDPLPAKIEFDYFPEIREGMRNVVVVGGSSRSDVSRDLTAELDRRGVRTRGQNAHAYFKDKAGREYRCEHAETDRGVIVTKDAGIIYRRTIDSGLTVLLCSGLHTFGSQAAATVALLPEFQRKVRNSRYKQFVQFVTVDVVASGDRAGLAPVRQSLRWQDLPLEKIE